MKYLEAVTIQFQLGNIEEYGMMGWKHVTQPTKPDSEHQNLMIETCYDKYGVHPFMLPVKWKHSIMEGFKNQAEWVAVNKHIIYWITSVPFGQITSHEQIIKIGMTSQKHGLIGRFWNYAGGIC